ncbi:Periplasmic serine endoprotease DegP [bacterium HR10]|nr:Periplasmic serine endoprotease DegP [bacterium HR10]
MTHRQGALQRRPKNSRLSLRIVVGLALSGSLAFAQAPSPHALKREPSATVAQRGEPAPESLPPPWLVTVIHRISVRDLLENLRRQGIQASALDGLTRSQQITNITTGLVVDERGRVLARLMSAISGSRETDVTVLTRDGRALRPTLVEYDEATGYAVLEVPALGIAPPPFVREGTSWSPDAPVKVFAQVPEIAPASGAHGTARRPSERAQATPMGGSELPSWRHLLPMRFKLEAARLKIAAALSASLRDRTDTHAESAADRPMLLLELPQANWSADGGVIVTEKGEVLGVAEEQAPGAYIVRSTESLRALTSRLLTRARAPAAKAQERAPAEAPRATARATSVVPTRGWIGIRAANLADLRDAERAALASVPGAAVIATEVIAGGPAERAGMRAGDVILQYRDQAVTSVEALADMIAQTPVGASVPVRIWREGEIRQLLISIEARPSGMILEPPPPPLFPTLSPENRHELTAQGVLTRWGLRVMDLTEQLADFFGVQRGVLILEVMPDGPAARAGARAGDVIVGVGSSPIRTRSDLLRALRALSGDAVTLRIVREREPLLMTLSLR